MSDEIIFSVCMNEPFDMDQLADKPSSLTMFVKYVIDVIKRRDEESKRFSDGSINALEQQKSTIQQIYERSLNELMQSDDMQYIGTRRLHTLEKSRLVDYIKGTYTHHNLGCGGIAEPASQTGSSCWKILNLYV